MTDCANLFVGTHDWTAFSSAQTDSETKTRTMTGLTIIRRWDQRAICNVIEMTASADGFLRYMVRSIAGTLMAVGRGELDNELVRHAIDEGDRSVAGATAPACGLTLLSVRYQ
jgi:tRNA pseudouridine38-40 synthase